VPSAASSSHPSAATRSIARRDANTSHIGTAPRPHREPAIAPGRAAAGWRLLERLFWTLPRVVSSLMRTESEARYLSRNNVPRMVDQRAAGPWRPSHRLTGAAHFGSALSGLIIARSVVGGPEPELIPMNGRALPTQSLPTWDLREARLPSDGLPSDWANLWADRLLRRPQIRELVLCWG
jgi:hypothetical protein